MEDPAEAPAAGRQKRRPRVIVAGAGFAGLEAARGLAGAAADVTLVDRHNHHLFQPLLYQVATATLSPAEIASPVRAILRDAPNVEVLVDEVAGIDPATSTIHFEGAGARTYDYLVLATGAGPSYFGHDDWYPFAPPLKTLADALDIRERLLLAYERAECETDVVRRRRLLTVVVVGAGPTGVELAGAIADLGRRSLVREFRHVDPADTRVILVEAGLKALPSFPPDLAAAAVRSLQRLGVEVRLGSPVKAVDADGVTIGDERVEAAVVLWAAGVAASPAAIWLGVEGDRNGRIAVAPDLSLPGRPEIFVIGDLALATGADGRPLPGLAPVATQQGRHVARRIRAAIGGNADPGAFRYLDRGNLATVGRNHAVADLPAPLLGRIHMHGFLGWILWGIVHVYFLIGFRNRIVVAVSWLWAYVTRRAGARIVTGRARRPPASPARAATPAGAGTEAGRAHSG